MVMPKILLSTAVICASLMRHTAARCQTSAGKTFGDVSVNSFHGLAAKAIVQVASANHIPLGIVQEGNALCDTQLHALAKEQVTVAQLVLELNNQLPSYSFQWEDDMLIGMPRHLSASARDLLAYRLRTFKTSPRDTHFGMGLSLWIFMRAQWYPDHGTGFAGGSPASEMLAGFSAENQTVQQILDRIVRLGSGGAWVITTTPSTDWRRQGQMPFSVYGYVGDRGELSQHICVSDESNTHVAPVR